MKDRSVKRWTALALTLVMALSLAVPAMGATPMLEEVEAVVEIPAVEDVGAMPGATPALDERVEAELSGTEWAHNFTTNGSTSTFYTFAGSVKDLTTEYAGALTGDYAGYTKGLLLEGSTPNISFKAPSNGKATILLVHPNQNKSFKVYEEGSQIAKPTMSSNPCFYTFNVTSGKTYAVGKDGTKICILTIEFEPDVPSCNVHTWGDWSEDTATCTEGGTKTRTCTVCKETETIETDPAGHTPASFAKEEPTCAEEGKEAGTRCSVCDALLTGGGTIPATGEHVDADNNGECDTCGKTMPTAHSHNFVTLVRNTATCTKAGVKTMACDWLNCDATQSEDVAALDHDWKSVTAKAATCTAIGWSAHQACNRCDAKENYTQFPALGHDFDPNTRECRNGCGTVMDSAGMNAGGWFEALYAEIDGVTDAQVAQVIYSGPVSGTLEDEDLEFLVRDAKLASGKNGVRIDIPGIPAGTYSLLVVTTSGLPYTATGIQVMAHDRSGYAHFNYTDGVGAYRDDGILKDNAIVLYVTEETKNTVSVTAPDGTTVTGIGNILNTAGMATSGGTTSKGGKANTNQDVLKKLAQAGIPLVVRIVGNVSSKHPAPQAGGIVGLTDYNSLDNGGTVKDQGNMARMKDAKDVTIEGIGADAVVDGWGFHFMASKGYPEFGKSFEVRNVTFRNVPEDCIGMEGQHENKVAYNVERGWVHNCSFYGPKISPSTEGDKDGGDGACDFKRGEYFTMDYCYYEGYHKTNLVGSGDSESNGTQHHITWHHNYYKSCESRGPLGRKANMHIYNCIFDNQTSYAQNTRTDGYIFSEYNVFNMSKQPRAVEGGAIKSYMDALRGCIGDGEKGGPATDVTDRLQVVTSGNLYESFELDSEVSYIPTGDYKLDKDHVTARANILAYAGPMKAKVVTPDEVDPSIVLADRVPTGNVALPFTGVDPSGNQTGVVLNNVNASLKLGKSTVGQNIVFKVGEPFDVTMSGTGINLVNEAGFTVIDENGTVKDLPAGTYFIEPNSMQPGSAADVTPATFKEGTLTGLNITAAANHVEPHVHRYGTYTKTKDPTCTTPGVMTATCTAGDGDVDTKEIAKIDHNYVDGVCEMCGLREGVYDPNAGGGDTPTIPTIVAVTGVTLDQESVYVDQDKTVTLIATVLPADATRKTVTWTSDDPNVATVSSNGLVTGKASGTTTITATTKDGGFEATCTVKVIGITKTEKKFVANDYGPKPQVNSKDPAATEADKAAIETKTGGAFTLSKVAGTWKMTGDKTYYVTASKGGNALEFTVTNPLNTVTLGVSSTGSSNFSVIALLNGDGARVADKAGKTVQAVKGTSATTITFEDLPVGTYQIVSPEVASTDVGGATGYDGRGVGIHTVTVTELQREDDDRVPVTSVTLAGADTVEMGKSITLTATVLPDDATTPKLKWTSSDTKVAMVTNGVVTGVKPGTVTITAAATDGSGKKDTKTITVTPGIVDQGNLGEAGKQVTWTLDSTGKLAVTNTNDRIETNDSILVALWGTGDKFLGVKLIRASQLSAEVGSGWDHLKLIWVNNKYAPKCDDVRVENDQ